MVPTLETARLVLPPVELADAEQVQQLFPHWEIVQYLANQVPWPYPPDGALKFYRNVAIPAMERGDAWHWTLRLKSDPGRIIGSIGLVKGSTKEGVGTRGFWLGLPWQGQGLMTEACDRVTDFCFIELGFKGLRIPKAIANTGSRRISEKQGMRVVAVEERDHVSGRLPAEIWEITREEWLAQRRKK